MFVMDLLGSDKIKKKMMNWIESDAIEMTEQAFDILARSGSGTNMKVVFQEQNLQE